MKNVSLDTNAYTRLLTGDQQILAALADAESIYVPVFVMAELLAGFKGGTQEKANRNLLNEFLSKETVMLIPATHKTAEIFAEIMIRLKKAGTPIPMNDVWIAAQAIETGSFLITCDKHFKHVQGLLRWNPAE